MFFGEQETFDEGHDNLEIGLRDEDIRAALANARMHRGVTLLEPEEDKTADEQHLEDVEFAPQRKVRSDRPGPDGLYLNYKVPLRSPTHPHFLRSSLYYLNTMWKGFGNFRILFANETQTQSD
jgi:hypothetical protein